MSCPNECSGHGECRSMAYHASQRDLGFGVPATYSNWDHAMVHGCHCETEYFGYDCSKRHCPNGDDPLTGTVPATTQVNEKQNILCTATVGIGFFRIFYIWCRAERLHCRSKENQRLSWRMIVVSTNFERNWKYVGSFRN